MKIIPLQSGSNGNCYYVESGETALLFDAGISIRKAQSRLAVHARDLKKVKAIFVSHEHSDHIRYLGSFHRKFDLPIYITRPTLLAIEVGQKLVDLRRVRLFSSGESQSVGSITVHTIRTPHDGVDGVVFVVEDQDHRVGILTDLGHPFAELKQVLPSLDGVILESNYDERMLATGRYPEFLKRRIAGDRGHLSNVEAAQLVKTCNQGRLKWVCLCHLSSQNNCPEIALQTHQAILGTEFPIFFAWRDRVSDELEL